jgi:hypothetical protein
MTAMKSLLLLVCLSVVAFGCRESSNGAAPAASASTTTTASPSSLELVPNASFGPIRIGATKAEVDALGILKPHPQYSAMTIPFTVSYDDAGKVKRVQLTLKHAPGDVTVGSVTIPRTATFDDAKKLLGDCKDEPPAIGGTTSKCRGGAVSVQIGSGSPTEVWIIATRP